MPKKIEEIINIEIKCPGCKGFISETKVTGEGINCKECGTNLIKIKR